MVGGDAGAMAEAFKHLINGEAVGSVALHLERHCQGPPGADRGQAREPQRLASAEFELDLASA
jgi:hypothetical protein